jgi:recombination protein RecA
MAESERDRALESTLTHIKRRFGEGAIMKLGDASSAAIEVIPTGSLALDVALGVGGIPRGRIVEIYGPESSGKTTLCQHIIAEAQHAGGVAAFIDVEHALDPSYAAKCGVDVDNLLVSQPDTGEQALEICEALVRSSVVDVIVVDSVAALVPRAEIEGDMGDSHVGLQARLMSQALRKLAGAISRSNCAVVFTNQLRLKIGVMFGNPETTSGGMALKFYASIRLDVRRVEAVKSGNDVIGSRTRVRVKKNKVAPPFKEAEFDIMYNEGVSRFGDVLDMAVEHGVMDKRGSYFFYAEDRIGQGRENAKEALRDAPELALEIENKVREALGLPPRGQAANVARPRADAELADGSSPVSSIESPPLGKNRAEAPRPAAGRPSSRAARSPTVADGLGSLEPELDGQSPFEPLEA